jgi:hemerythrin
MIEWKPEFSVNNDEMDEQHKVLVGMLDDIDRMIQSEDFNYINLVNIVEGLEKYIRVHFDYEEDLMFRLSYPYITEHTREHNVFRDKLQNTYVLDIEKPKEFYYEMSDYLLNWLSGHILKVDRQLGSFLTERGI